MMRGTLFSRLGVTAWAWMAMACGCEQGHCGHGLGGRHGAWTWADVNEQPNAKPTTLLLAPATQSLAGIQAKLEVFW